MSRSVVSAFGTHALRQISTFAPVRGMRDIMGDRCKNLRTIEARAQETAELYGYEELSTPILEETSLFRRSLGGDHAEIVRKEMYEFVDRSKKHLALRPENTASAMRAVLQSGGLTKHGGSALRHFYRGPMFRHERPQNGRQRQFHQFGVEIYGAAEAESDVEVIAIAHRLLKKLGLRSHVRLHLNTIGDSASRSQFCAALDRHFSAFRLSPASAANVRGGRVLRVLESKHEADAGAVQTAPLLAEFLSTSAAERHAVVCEGLRALDIPFHEDPLLVRGLDYYSHTAFEFVYSSPGGEQQDDAPPLGPSQSTVLGGGRYDGLAEALGARCSVPAIGWAAGTERLEACMLAHGQLRSEATPSVLVREPLVHPSPHTIPLN